MQKGVSIEISPCQHMNKAACDESWRFAPDDEINYLEGMEDGLWCARVHYQAPRTWKLTRSEDETTQLLQGEFDKNSMRYDS
jgi:hypothetical protein